MVSEVSVRMTCDCVASSLQVGDMWLPVESGAVRPDASHFMASTRGGPPARVSTAGATITLKGAGEGATGTSKAVEGEGEEDDEAAGSDWDRPAAGHQDDDDE